MGRPTPHRRLLDPFDMRGIPKLNKRRREDREPVRGRKCDGQCDGHRPPLQGTKVLATPKDEGLEELVRRTMDRSPLPCRTSAILGWAAVAGAVGFLGLFWYLLRTPGVSLYSHGGRYVALVILMLGGTHVLAIFSQIMSEGRNKPGGWALPGLYVGSILVAVMDHLLG